MTASGETLQINCQIMNILPLLCIFCISTVRSDSLSKSVTVFTKPYFRGTNLTLEVSSCASIPHQAIQGGISSINSDGNCVNLFKSNNCTGEYIIIQPGNPIHYDLNEWQGFNNNVNSIQICYPRCDPRSVEKLRKNLTYLVTLYDDSLYKGSHVTIDLANSTCKLLPLKLKRRISSIKVHGNFCVELHHNWNCSLKNTPIFAKLRPGSPSHTDLRHWTGHDDKAVAISLCGHDCNSSTMLIEANVNKSIAINMTKLEMNNQITIFDEDDAFFHGHFKNLTFSKDEECMNMDYEWEGQIGCINTYGKCVVMYDEFNCSTTAIGRNFTIIANATDNVAALLKDANFSRVAQSLRICHNHFAKNITQEKHFILETNATSILFIVIFSLVIFSFCSVGVAFGINRYRCGSRFRLNRGSDGSLSPMF